EGGGGGRGDGGGGGGGIEGGGRDRGVVDLGQRRDRQQPIGEGAGEQQRRHQQRRGDGSQDERTRQVHDEALSVAPPPPSARSVTVAPSRSRSAPSTTTRSPGLSPESITTSSPSATPTATLRAPPFWPGIPTDTHVAGGVGCSGDAGITGAGCWMSSRKRTLTNWLGNSRLSGLGKTGLSLTVPVVGSAWLSIVRSKPVASLWRC